MARMPGATWRPISENHSYGGMGTIHGVVLHIMQGTLDGSDAWFRNPAAQASAHFGVGKDGRIFQWVDTHDKAWAEVAGNSNWISIEHEGNSGDKLTDAQLAASARVCAWAARTHGFPLQITDSPNGQGIGWHGMGGAAWGGHYDCPGTPIKNQRAELIAIAKGDAPAPEEDELKYVSLSTKKPLKGKRGDTPSVVWDKVYAGEKKDGIIPVSPAVAVVEVTSSVPHELYTQDKDGKEHNLGGNQVSVVYLGDGDVLYCRLLFDTDEEFQVTPYVKAAYSAL